MSHYIMNYNGMTLQDLVKVKLLNLGNINIFSNNCTFTFSIIIAMYGISYVSASRPLERIGVVFINHTKQGTVA